MVQGYNSSLPQRVGYGQVEINHVSAPRTGQVYAQLPAGSKTGNTFTPIAQLEQGQFLKYNYAGGFAGVTGDGEWMLVYNEEKLYDERKQNHKDFCVKKTDFTDGVIYPRLLKTNVGDIFTTNTFGGSAESDSATTSFTAMNVGDKLEVNAQGFLDAVSEHPTAPIFQVVKVYTMPDGQMGIKVQRVE